MFNGGVAEMRALAGSLDAMARDFAVSLTEYEHRDFSLIDITSPAATKGRALAWRAGELGVGPEEVMAVGDNFNDVELLRYAGRPVVMSQAPPGVREEGWAVTASNDADGVAAAIEAYILNDGIP